jgi:hypothetical protein
MSMIAVIAAPGGGFAGALSAGTLAGKPRSRGRRRAFRRGFAALANRSNVSLAPPREWAAPLGKKDRPIMADTTDTPTGGRKPAASPRPRKPAASKSAKPKSAAAKRTTAKKPAARSGNANGAKTGGSKGSNRSKARTRFSAAIEEARAGVAALRSDAVERTAAYRRTAADGAVDWVEDAKAMGEQARKRAGQLAKDGKTRASDGLAALGKTVSDTAATIDDKLGKQYGDYARTAARSIQEAAAKLDSKDLGEMGEDAREFIRKSPGAAIGIAAVAGFFLARMFRGSDD